MFIWSYTLDDWRMEVGSFIGETVFWFAVEFRLEQSDGSEWLLLLLCDPPVLALCSKWGISVISGFARPSICVLAWERIERTFHILPRARTLVLFWWRDAAAATDCELPKAKLINRTRPPYIGEKFSKSSWKILSPTIHKLIHSPNINEHQWKLNIQDA